MRKKAQRRWRRYTPKQTDKGNWKFQWPVPGTTSAGNQKVQTETFDTKHEAYAFAAKINNKFRVEGLKRQEKLISDDDYSPMGIPAKEVTVNEAGDYYIEAFYNALKSQSSFEEKRLGKRRANEVLETLGEYTDTYVSLYTLENKYAPAIKMLCGEDQLGSMLLRDVTVSDLRLHLVYLDLAISTYNDRIGIIDRFFKWCMEPCRGYIQASPATGLKRLAHQWEEPEILSVDETYRVFRAAEKIDPGIIPTLTLRAHAGIRSCETMRMNEGDLNWEFQTIRIRKDVAKPSGPDKPLPRTLELLQDMPDTVWLWLKSVGGNNMKIDSVSLYKRMKAVFAEAQTEYRHNCLRHSFCSYAYSLLGDAGKVRKWSGHRREKTFHDCYVNVTRTSLAEAEKYFSLKPTGNHVARLGLRRTRHQPRIDWPNDADFLDLISQLSNVKIAQILHCTETAVRKERKKRGI